MLATRTKVAVLCGGPSPEHEVSLASGENVLRNLDSRRFVAEKIVIDKSGKFPIPLEGLKKFDLAFLAMHGPFGEDGTIQAILESLGVLYTGSGVAASILGMDKVASKRLFAAAGFNIAPFQVTENLKDLFKIAKVFGFPLIVKPSNQGSSIGVSLVEKSGELAGAFDKASFYGPVIAEKFIRGREIQAGILGDEALPLVEIKPKRKFFDYEAKYDPSLSEEITPALVDQKMTERIQDIALGVFKLLGCRHFGRVDLFYSDEGEVIVSEINTIPGLTENSLFPKATAAAGLAFLQVLEKIIDLALAKR